MKHMTYFADNEPQMVVVRFYLSINAWKRMKKKHWFKRFRKFVEKYEFNPDGHIRVIGAISEAHHT